MINMVDKNSILIMYDVWFDYSTGYSITTLVALELFQGVGNYRCCRGMNLFLGGLISSCKSPSWNNDFKEPPSNFTSSFNGKI